MKLIKILFFLMLCLSLTKIGFSQGQNTILTIQVATYSSKELTSAVKTAQLLENKNYENVRVEHIGNFYTLRVGNYKNSDEAKKQYKSFKKLFPTSFIRTAYYLEERIIYSATLEKANAEKELKQKQQLAQSEAEEIIKIAKKTEQDSAAAQEYARETVQTAQKAQQIAMKIKEFEWEAVQQAQKDADNSAKTAIEKAGIATAIAKDAGEAALIAKKTVEETLDAVKNLQMDKLTTARTTAEETSVIAENAVVDISALLKETIETLESVKQSEEDAKAIAKEVEEKIKQAERDRILAEEERKKEEEYAKKLADEKASVKKNRFEANISYEYLVPSDVYESWTTLNLGFYRKESDTFTYFFQLESFLREENGVLFTTGAYKDWTESMFTYSSLSAGSNTDFLPQIRLDNDFYFKTGKEKNIIWVLGGSYIDYFGDHKDLILSTGITTYLKKWILGYRIFRNQSDPGSVISFSHTISGGYGEEGKQWIYLTFSTGKQAYLATNLATPEEVNQPSYGITLSLRRWLRLPSGILAEISYFNLKDGYEKYGFSTGMFREF